MARVSCSGIAPLPHWPIAPFRPTAVRWLASHSRRRGMRVPVVIGILIMAALSAVAGQQNPYLGAWNMTGTGSDSSFIYWLEIKESNGQLTGMFLNRSGNPNPLAVVKVENVELVFQGGQPG